MSTKKAPAKKRAAKLTRQTSADIARLKDEFVAYFEEVPVQKYAAMYIGRTEQTVIDWLNKDEGFFNRVQVARAKWVKKKALRVKAEFALERLEKDVWAERKEVTGPNGAPMEVAQVLDLGAVPAKQETNGQVQRKASTGS